MSFLTPEIMKGTDWRSLERAVARLMSHTGWSSVRLIGGKGDKGGDILAVRKVEGQEKTYVIQVKAVIGGNYVGVSALQEVLNAQTIYGADLAIVATNGSFTKSALLRQQDLAAGGFDVRLWNGIFLQDLIDKLPTASVMRRELRPYQTKIVNKCLDAYSVGSRRVQFILATGLGKSIVAADLVAKLSDLGLTKILVLCHSTDLALQLEQAFWLQLDKSIPTRYFFDGEPPKPYAGLNFGLYQTLAGYLNSVDAGTFDVVVVDEAHHALAFGYSKCLMHLAPKLLVGMTATPWRGDGLSLDTLFGPPVDKVSLVDGMAMGFLSQVDYRIYSDNVDWRGIQQLSRAKLTIGDLNKRLFLPQRDEAAISEIKKVTTEIAQPRIIIFCPSIEHCRRFANLLTSEIGLPCKALSGENKVERNRRLMEFASGRLQAVTSVDLLNEGIDVPEVNMLVFLRATHSRRIFVQQLGRGLRISSGKKRVIVLDFVSDIRRLAEVVQMDKDARNYPGTPENVYIHNGIITFNNLTELPFIDQWLQDVTDLGNADEAQNLEFPPIP